MKDVLTLQQLQSITLESQGLSKTATFGYGKNAVLTALEQLGYVQIDTLSIVERAHHHTLWTRIPDYKTSYLEELVTERKVFEYWFHAASYLPMKDFRYALPQMLAVKENQSHYSSADPRIMNYVMDTIRAEGPKKSRDFESVNNNLGSWWNWKPAKLALERLFMQGDLMISGRNGMQKTYDLTERVLPTSIDTREPSALDFAEYLVKTYLKAYGFTTLKQITHLKTGALVKKNVNEVLKAMLDERTIQQLNVEGMPAVFVQNDKVGKTFSKPKFTIHLLSPFDNSIIHRNRVKQLFDFDYRIECYTPKEKRQYGYFTLPILFGNTFIGRVDCKTHRKEKKFELIHLHIENTSIDIDLWLKPFVETVRSFAEFNGCETIFLTRVSPDELMGFIVDALENFD